MYNYKFVEVQVGSFTGIAKEDYQAIIREHELDCWRLHTSNHYLLDWWASITNTANLLKRNSIMKRLRVEISLSLLFIK